MGGWLLALGFVGLTLSYSKKKGWDRDCLIGGIIGIGAGIVILAHGG